MLSEKAIIRKLVESWHLNTQERAMLPNGKAKASMLCEAIEDSLARTPWFPIEWRPDDNFDGGLLELKEDGSCLLYWKHEIGCQRFALASVQTYGSTKEAIQTYIKQFFGENIDGVEIDWTA